MRTGTLKTSTIFVSVGPHTGVYPSADKMPPSLRRKFEKTTTGTNSATILIADRKGKEELVRAIEGLPSSIPLRVTGKNRRRKENREKVKRARARRLWLEMGLIAVLGTLLWCLTLWDPAS